MTILTELLKSSPSKIIDLYEADFSYIPTFSIEDGILDTNILRFSSDTTEIGSTIWWAGNEYTPIPCELDGFEWHGGQLPTPKLKLGNPDGTISVLNREYNDLIGLKFTRIRTMVKYLDAINFISGNPDADPTAELPKEIYYIDRKAAENKLYVEYDLVSAADISSIALPRRLIVQNLCSWRYKDANCGYIPSENDNRMFTETGLPTTNPLLDKCGHRLLDCTKRFGTYGVLNYGGFPGAGLYS